MPVIRVTPAEDGIVRIGDGSATGPAFTRAVLDVAGAVLTWPVLDGAASRPPAAEIHDPGRAQQWLWALYGEPVSAAVHTGAPAEADLPERRPALARDAARLALGHWAARWWPASYLDGIPALEPDVLGLELAASTHECQQLFDDLDDQPDGCAAELLAEHRAGLDPLLRWWRSAGATAHRLDRVLRLVDDAADNAGLDGEELHRLHSALERGGDPSGTPPDLAALFVRHSGYALAAGEPPSATGRVIARGSGTNDWCRYPPGFVDAAENAVSWTAYAVGAGRRIEVEVVADIAAPVDGVRLAAEVRVDGGPSGRVPLARRGDAWTGRADLDLPAVTTPRIEVGVLLPGFDPGPDPGADDRAAREAVRALARHRLAVAGETGTESFLAEMVAARAVEEDF